MNEYQEFCELLLSAGIFENTTYLNVGLDEALTDESYLLKGERIFSLAREKRHKEQRKSQNLTVRLCDLKFPLLSCDDLDAHKQLNNSIKKFIRQEFKKIDQAEKYSSIEDISFFYLFSHLMPTDNLSVNTLCTETEIARAVTGSNNILCISFSESDFYIPCTPQKRFQNTEYYFRSNPTVTASIIHCEQIFLYFFLIHWCNDLIMKSRREEECHLILKQMLIKNTSSLQVCNWSTEKMPDWFEQYLIDSGLEKRNDIYSPAKVPSETLRKFNDSKDIAKYLTIVEHIYTYKQFEFSTIVFDQKYPLTDMLYPLDAVILDTLKYYVSAIQNERLEQHYRKQAEGEVARAYTTKRNIPQHILTEMKTSVFNKYFDFVEFDADIDKNSVNDIAEEFEKLNHRYFNDFKCKDTTFRIRKLGRHKAYGLYYIYLKTLVVDLRHPDSFVHEYFHAIDDNLGNLSQKFAFYKIVDRYSYLLSKTIKESEKNGKQILSNSGKYSLNYYLQRCEIFARCGEIYLFRLLHVESSLLKHPDTQSFAYPNDDELNTLIYDYYSFVIKNLGNDCKEGGILS